MYTHLNNRVRQEMKETRGERASTDFLLVVPRIVKRFALAKRAPCFLPDRLLSLSKLLKVKLPLQETEVEITYTWGD